MNDLAMTKKDEAFELHSRIMANGKIAATALVEVSKDLKSMRDDKLYLEIGYQSFDEYVEKAVGLKRRQAYSYISAYEKLGEKFLSENSSYGITKLELISQIDAYEREAFLEENDVEDLSTRELKELVEKQKKQIEQITFQLENSKNDTEKAKSLEEQLKELKSENEKLRYSLENQEEKIVTQVISDENAVATAVKEAETKKNEEIAELKKKYQDEKKQAIQKATAEADELLKSAEAEVDRLKKQAEEKDEKLNSALKKAKEAGADENVVMLKFKFSNMQATANDLLDLLDKVRQSDSATAEKLANGIAQTLTRYAERMKKFD